MSAREPFIEAWKEMQANSDAVKALPEAVRARRSTALELFGSVGFPTPADEEWKYTDLAPVAALPYKPGFRYVKNGIAASDVAYWNFDHPEGWSVLVFVDGHFAADLSRISPSPRESEASAMTVGSIAAIVASKHPVARVIEEHLGAHATEKLGPALLNTAFLQDGAFVHVPRGVVAPGPITIVHVATSRPSGRVTHPRTLIVVEAGAKATVVERYVGLGAASACTFANAVSEIVVGDGGNCDHYRVQKDEETSYHVGYSQSVLGRDSRFETHSLVVGAKFVRNNTHALLGGSGIVATVNGLYLATDGQHVDNHTAIDHANPHCDSHELYKGILDGKSRAVFNGKIFVRKDAQKTDSKQTNRNLLLSENARVDTKPQLEIFADDVKCTHGATIGQLDEDQVFYLQSRGIDRPTAIDLLTYGFAHDVLDRIGCEPVVGQLDTVLRRRLRDRRTAA